MLKDKKEANIMFQLRKITTSPNGTAYNGPKYVINIHIVLKLE